jgi:hypothetical protein
MAESYKSGEPTVSIHGVPRSEFNAQQSQQAQPSTGPTGQPMVSTTGQAQGGIANHFKQHWVIYTLIIGAASLVLMYLIYRSQNAASNAATNTGNNANGSTGYPPTADNLWGAQLDSDYQQLASMQNTNTGLLQSILTAITAPVKPPAPSTTPTPVPTPGTHPKWVNPLIPFGQWPTNHPYSNSFDLMEHPTITWQGTTYKENPGAGGRLWGDPIAGPLKGTPSVLLYAPRSYYH